jgi:hypothetical protein
VTSTNPNTGTTAGGIGTQINGTGFTGATGATFGGVAATNFSVTSDTVIMCMTPPHAAGAVPVVVQSPNGNGTLPNGYTYAVPQATVASLNPSSGPEAGGTPVVVTGTNLTLATAVVFGTNPGTAFSVVNATTINVTTPAGTATGAVNVIVQAGAAGNPQLANGYSYE